MNGYKTINHGKCKFCGKEIFTQYGNKHYEYCDSHDTEEKRLQIEGAKAVVHLKTLEKETNKLYQALIKPKGLRLRLLRWLYPEIVNVADSLRECYWS